jgi:hypothetical protein
MIVRKRVLVTAVVLVALACGTNLKPPNAAGQSPSFRVLGQAYVAVGDAVYYLDLNNVPYGWKQLPFATHTLPPVPASTLISYDGFLAVTEAGEGWGMAYGEWTSFGPVPTTPTVRTSWGQVKSRYSEK